MDLLLAVLIILLAFAVFGGFLINPWIFVLILVVIVVFVFSRGRTGRL